MGNICDKCFSVILLRLRRVQQFFRFADTSALCTIKTNLLFADLSISLK